MRPVQQKPGANAWRQKQKDRMTEGDGECVNCNVTFKPIVVKAMDACRSLCHHLILKLCNSCWLAAGNLILARYVVHRDVRHRGEYMWRTFRKLHIYQQCSQRKFRAQVRTFRVFDKFGRRHESHCHISSCKMPQWQANEKQSASKGHIEQIISDCFPVQLARDCNGSCIIM